MLRVSGEVRCCERCQALPHRWRPAVVMMETRYNDGHFVNNFPQLVENSKQAAQILYDNGYRVVYEDHQNSFFLSDLLGGAVLK